MQQPTVLHSVRLGVALPRPHSMGEERSRSTRRPVRPALWAYLGAMAVGAGALSAHLAWRFGVSGSATELALMAVFACFGALAARYPLVISPKVKVYVSTIPYFMAVLLLHPFMAVLAVSAGSAMGDVIGRRKLHNIVFTAVAAALAIGLATWAYRSVFSTERTEAGLAEAGVAVAWVALPAVVMFLVNTWSVAVAAGLQLEKSPFAIWTQGRSRSVLEEVSLYAFAVVGALVVDNFIWSLIILVIPTIAVYFSLQRSSQEAQRNADLSQRLQEQMLELRQTQAQLIQSAKLASIGTLASGVAHEINNPIFVIQGRADMLLSNPDEHLKTPKAKQFVETIHQMSRRISQITSGLLAFSRTDGIWEWHSVNAVLEETLELQSQFLAKSKVQADKRYASGLPQVWCCKNTLQQVVWNLIANARDAMPQGGTLSLSTELRGDVLAISVADTGAGIPQEHLGRLFEPFFTTKQVGKGTGLGLHVSRRIIEQHGGTIEVESAVGKGSVFRVLLPLKAPENAPEAADSGPQVKTSGL